MRKLRFAHESAVATVRPSPRANSIHEVVLIIVAGYCCSGAGRLNTFSKLGAGVAPLERATKKLCS